MLELALSIEAAAATWVPTAIASSPITAPVLTLTSAPGATPISFDVSSTDYTASFYGQLQIASDSGFTTITQNIVHDPDGAEWATLDASYGFVDPSGAYWARFRFLEDDPNGTTTVTDQLGNTFTATASAWSNPVNDTILTSSAVLNNVTGVNKSQYLNVASPYHQAIVNNVVGANCLSRATVAAANTKFHAEFTANSFQAAGGNSLFECGFDDGTPSLQTTGPNAGSTGHNGISLRGVKGSTSLTFYHDLNTGAALTLPNALTDGDTFAWDVDTSAHSAKITYYHSGTATVLTTITLATGIPSSWFAVCGGGCGNGTAGTGTSDAVTFNAGASTNLVTPQAGYGIYG